MKTVDDILLMLKDNAMVKVPVGIQTDRPLSEQGFDSLDVIMLLHEVEANFNIRIPQEQTNQMRSLQDVVNFLNTTPVS